MDSKQLIIPTEMREEKEEVVANRDHLKNLIVFDALRELMKPPAKPRRKIGFEGKA